MGQFSAPFEIESLGRDWIAGAPGVTFRRRVEGCIDAIRAEPDTSTRGVLIAERDPVDFSAAFFAAVFLGTPVMLANPRWGQLEWEEVASSVNPARCYGASQMTVLPRSDIEPLKSGDILIPTGGSSGGVKFAVHDWSSLRAAWRGFEAFIEPGAYNAHCVLPLYHVSGLMQLVRAFLSGGQIAFPDFKTLQSVGFPSGRVQGYCLSLVTTQLQRLLSQSQLHSELEAARAIFVGGGPMSEALAEQARVLRLPIILSYGMTETAAMVAAMPTEEFLAGRVTAGRPLDHVTVDIVSPTGSRCAVGEPGRIRIAGDCLFKGYRGSSGGLQGDGRYLTDDEGFVDEQDRLHVIGRIDRLIVSGGEKIDPREVEVAIRETGLVEEVLAVGRSDPEWGQMLVAFYTTSTDSEVSKDLEGRVREQLANYKRPKQMIRVPKLPLNEKGKLDHRLIDQILGEVAESTD